MHACLENNKTNNTFLKYNKEFNYLLNRMSDLISLNPKHLVVIFILFKNSFRSRVYCMLNIFSCRA